MNIRFFPFLSLGFVLWLTGCKGPGKSNSSTKISGDHFAVEPDRFPAADLNIHAHILCADGVWYEAGEDIQFKKLDRMKS